MPQKKSRNELLRDFDFITYQIYEAISSRFSKFFVNVWCA